MATTAQSTLRWICCALASVVVVVNGQQDPVMAGYDVVAYHSLDPLDNGVPGSSTFQSQYDGYVYYFRNDENRMEFEAQPEFYKPQYGGFCAWGIAWEYENEGWPWQRSHMGPPCGPSDGWALLPDENGTPKLYCSIWRSYQEDFNTKREEGIRLADERWITYYGSLDAGPMNNGCYAWFVLFSYTSFFLTNCYGIRCFCVETRLLS